MTTFNRRDILRAGGVGALFTAFANAKTPVRVLSSFAPLVTQPPITAPRLLTIFLRGGHDGVYTVVPTGDPTYTTARPTLQPTTIALPGTTYAQLNSAYSALMPIINANQAAFIHQVGNRGGGRSHFVEMQVYEGAAISPMRDDGVIARVPFAAQFTGTVKAATVSYRAQQLYRGFNANEVMAYVAGTKNLAGTNNWVFDYTLGASNIAARQRDSMALHLTQNPTAPLEAQIDATGEYVALTEAMISGLVYAHDAAAFPMSAAESTAQGLPNSSVGQNFLSHCEQAIQLLQAPIGAQAVGIEMGAWDTHNNQAAERAPLDVYLAKGIRSIYDAAALAGMTDFVILVMTEFGRTNIENGSAGTDHGVGGLMMAFGPSVNGGVYNCHGGSGLGASWRPLGTTPGTYTPFQNACPVATDFRLIYAELFDKLFNIPGGSPTMASVIPGFTSTNYLGCFL